MVVWTRPSGSIIELEDTENFENLAKSNGWTRAAKMDLSRDVIDSHMAKIHEIGDKDELKTYLSEIDGLVMNMQGGVGKLKEKALVALNGF